MRRIRAKENAQRQEEYLEQAYQENLANRTDDSDDDDWDPIEDIIENEHSTYVELIRHFLWTDLQDEEDVLDVSASAPASIPPTTAPESYIDVDEVNAAGPGSGAPSSEIGRKRKKGKGKVQKKASASSEPSNELESSKISEGETKGRAAPMIVRTETQDRQSEKKPDITKIESREELLNRLLEGTRSADDKLMCKENGKHQRFERMPPMPTDGANRLVEEISEIKNYIFCRLLLNNVALLASAIRANNLDEFFKDDTIKARDLRDLCLRLEQPELSDIRDACADFARRGDAGPLEKMDIDQSDEDSSESDHDPMAFYKEKKEKRRKQKQHKHHLPNTWRSSKEKSLRAPQPEMEPVIQRILENAQGMDDMQGGHIDFGALDDKGQAQDVNVRVKICGRYIYNYPSQGAMKRGGWLHFSIMAQGSTLAEAAHLCKSWDEFFELNVLAILRYFPAPEWLLWAGDMIRQQFLQIVSLPFYLLF